eukprot:356695-Chlamydomonas_euryale.AAC.3
MEPTACAGLHAIHRHAAPEGGAQAGLLLGEKPRCGSKGQQAEPLTYIHVLYDPLGLLDLATVRRIVRHERGGAREGAREAGRVGRQAAGQVSTRCAPFRATAPAAVRAASAAPAPAVNEARG